LSLADGPPPNRIVAASRGHSYQYAPPRSSICLNEAFGVKPRAWVLDGLLDIEDEDTSGILALRFPQYAAGALEEDAGQPMSLGLGTDVDTPIAASRTGLQSWQSFRLRISRRW
jgi:hypothetical protein